MRAAHSLPILLCGLWPSLAWAACDAPVPLESLQATLASQEAALGSLDFPVFDVSFRKLQEELPCVDHRLSTADAARVHRMYGVGFFTQDRIAESAHSFAAARLLDPAWAIPESVGVGTPLRAVWDQSLGEVVGGTEAIGLRGTWVVDGVLSNRRPTAWPAVIQEERKGAIYTTDYLLPGEPVKQPGGPPIPKYAVPLTVAAGGAFLAAVGLVAGAAVSHEDFDRPHSASELYELQDQTNALGGSGVGLGVLAIGLGVGAVVSWTF